MIAGGYWISLVYDGVLVIVTVVMFAALWVLCLIVVLCCLVVL